MKPASVPPAQGLSRRNILEILGLGLAGIGSLGACADGDEKEQGSTSGDDGAEFHGAWPYIPPPTGHFNLFTDLLDRMDLGIYFDLIMAPGGMWHWAAEKWLHLVCGSFEFNDQGFVYNIADGVGWSDGEPLTAADVETTFWCRWIMHQREWEFVKGLSITGERQVTFALDSPANTLEYYILRANIFPYRIYGQFAAQARELFEAGTPADGPEMGTLNNEFQSWRPIDPAEDDSEVVTSGPFRYEFESITEEQLVLVKNSGGILADQVEFDRILIYNGETEKVTPLVLDKKVDYATHGFPPKTQERIEQRGLRILEPSTYLGTGLLFCMDQKPMFKDVKARQAFAYAIDRARAAATALGDAAKPTESMTGLSDLVVREWLSPAERAKLDGYEYDQQKAIALLTAAGWTRVENGWKTPDGSPARFDLLVAEDFDDHRGTAVSVVEQLGDLGIVLEQVLVRGSEMDGLLAKGQFELAIYAWGRGDPHPYFSFERNLITDNIPASINQLGRGMGFELVQQTERFGEVDIQRLLNESGSGLDVEAQQPSVAKLALVYNELLPRIQIFERYGNNAALEGVRVKEWPPATDPIYRNGPYSDNQAVMLLYEGRLEPTRP